MEISFERFNDYDNEGESGPASKNEKMKFLSFVICNSPSFGVSKTGSLSLNSQAVFENWYGKSSEIYPKFLSAYTFSSLVVN